ncbi:hypothetical protein [Amycolatopsis sp. NPDC004378]
MSYFPFRDHPDLAKLDSELVGRLVDLTGQANAVTVAGVHKDLCGCSDSGCDYLGQLQLNTTASGPEVLAYLAARGMLRLDDEHPGPFRLGRSHNDIVYETIEGEEHRNHPRVCVATSPAYARRIKFALNQMGGSVSHGTLVGAVMEMTGCAPSDARKVIEVLRPDLSPTAGGES